MKLKVTSVPVGDDTSEAGSMWPSSLRSMKTPWSAPSSLIMWTVRLSPTFAVIVGPGFVSVPAVKDHPPAAVPYRLRDRAAAPTEGAR